jgi:hypothetical protein
VLAFDEVGGVVSVAAEVELMDTELLELQMLVLVVVMAW